MPTTAARQLQQIAQRVRTLRAEQGWRQYQLAEKADVSTRTVEAIEGGAHRAHISTYGRLARALGVSVSELVDHDNEGTAA